MLEVEQLHAAYGAVVALSGVSLKVPDGGIVAVLGANGAGKSTLMRAISGVVRATSGSVRYDGRDLHHLPAERIVRLGVVQVPEGRQLFTQMTVVENLRLGAYARRDRAAIAADMDRVFSYFPRLKERASQPAGTLSGGEQQMLALGRALMARPRLLLLDEPSLGLAPLVVREIFQIVQAVNRDQGCSVLVVEQDVSVALEVAQFGYVLETGRIVVGDSSARLRQDEALRRAYLGY